ncbi:Lysosome-associated membrane glycoprotein [Necator americanus]|uniref:Lysosome-associated membrane glycoprotein n=1 Tax=Necator americanus TaxID=51031 RepID=W2TDZ0_NECAM|nr:Lysosome-associated membrane glycoprotein [Necator americanus]ETN79789.1 Lysosome-associated membrane glycoprotein [Necator americanus]
MAHRRCCPPLRHAGCTTEKNIDETMIRSTIFLGVFAVAFAEHWTVLNNNTKRYCIILDSASVTMTVKFTGKDGVVETYNAAINGTHDVSGNCQDTYGNQTAQSVKVSFFPAGEETPAIAAQPWELELFFGSEEKTYAFGLLDYSLTTAPALGMNASSIYKFTKANDHIDLQAQGTNAFKCSVSGLALSNDSIIEMKDVRVIAFAQLDQPSFPEQQIYEQCLLDSRTSDIVPIVVGACLAGLVVVVLVAYLIGRARAKREGYASV